MKKTMPKLLAAAFILFAAALNASGQSQKFETRCGWLDNPTPANFSFYDKDRDWIIGVQGSYQIEDIVLPDFKPKQWVETNGSYGYGCACLQMSVDKKTSHVLKIKKASARPLAACRKDRALRKWKVELK